MIADDFLLPYWASTEMDGEIINTARYHELILLNKEMALFEECIQQINSQLLRFRNLQLSMKPLVCITPLLKTDDGE